MVNHGVVTVEPEKVRIALHMCGREHEFRAFEAHVIGGMRYAHTAAAARVRGWDDIADFIETFAMLQGAS
jgi:hypothetical protein